MRIDKGQFYTEVRSTLFGGRLQEGQVQGMEEILDFFFADPTRDDLRKLAYPLATTKWETVTTMQPVRETLAPTDDRAIAILEKSWKAGRMKWVETPYWRKDENGISWLGRGLVQLTFEDNYRRLSPHVGVDLVANPALAMDPDISVKIMFAGMDKGLFTGKKLSDYFNDTRSDAVNARGIINNDVKLHGAAIAGLYVKFLNALKGSVT